MTSSQKAVLFIDSFLNLEYKHKRAIINLYDDVGNLFTEPNLAIDYLEINCNKQISTAFENAINSGLLDSLIEKYQNANIEIIDESSPFYPKRLLNLDFRPICLYAKGKVELLNSKNSFSIVGARKTQPLYLKMCEEFSQKLSSAGVTIVTGVAVGGDLSALKGSVDSGKVICVLAGGFSHIKNECNRDYILKVIKNGLVITEHPLEVIPRNYHYPVRNRIIAGLSDGVLIASGQNTSGCRHTANYALDYGLEIFAFPYAPNEIYGELCNSLIKDGARICTQIEDIVEVMGYDIKNNQQLSLSNNEKLVYELIKNGNNSVDDILSKSNLKIYELVPLLTSLEIKGVIVKKEGSEYGVLK